MGIENKCEECERTCPRRIKDYAEGIIDGSATISVQESEKRAQDNLRYWGRPNLLQRAYHFLFGRHWEYPRR